MKHNNSIASNDGSKLGKLELFGYSIMAFGSDFWGAYISAFILLFYTDVAKIPPAIAGLIISLATYWDAINDPIIANIADNHAFKNGDKCRPYLVLASIPVAVLLALMFLKVGDGGTLTVIYCFVTYFLFRIPSTFHNLPCSNMRQLATAHDDQRVRINTFTSFGGNLGIACTTLIMWPLLRFTAGTDEVGNMINPERGYFLGAIIVGVIVVGTSLFNYFTTRERVHPLKQEKIPFLYSCKVVLKNRQFIQTLFISFFYGTITSFITGYSLYYCQYVICRPALATPITALYMVGLVLTLPFVSKIYRHFGRNKMLMCGAAVLFVSGAFFLAFPKMIITPFIFCFFAGIGCGLTVIMINLNRASVTDIIEFNDGGRMDSMVTNVQNLIKKFASGLLSFILGIVLQLARYDGDAGIGNQPESAVRAIILIMGLGTVICAVVYFVIAMRLDVDAELSVINDLKAQGFRSREDAEKAGKL